MGEMTTVFQDIIRERWHIVWFCLYEMSRIGKCCAVLLLQLYLTLCDPMDNSPSREFSRQEYWSGLPWLPQGDLPHPGMEPASPAASAMRADSFPLSQLGSPEQISIQTIRSRLLFRQTWGNWKEWEWSLICTRFLFWNFESVKLIVSMVAQ